VARRAVLSWGVAGALTALPGCTPYAQGYAYTTHQSFPSGAPPAAPPPAASPTPVASADASASMPADMHAAMSDRLTYYLQGHRLPLVGAQVADAADGNHQVILSGFVATDHGKSDAEEKARRFLNEPNAEIDNRIVVKPELQAPPSPPLAAAASSFPPPATSSPGAPAAPAQQLQPAQVNQLLGALLLGMAIVSTLPTAGAPGAGVAPPPASSSGAPPSP